MTPLNGEFPPRDSETDAGEPAVVEIRDQGGARAAQPDFAKIVEWMHFLKPTESVTLLHRDGGTLQLTSDRAHQYSVRRADALRRITAESGTLNEQQARLIVRRYLAGNQTLCAADFIAAVPEQSPKAPAQPMDPNCELEFGIVRSPVRPELVEKKWALPAGDIGMRFVSRGAPAEVDASLWKVDVAAGTRRLITRNTLKVSSGGEAEAIVWPISEGGLYAVRIVDPQRGSTLASGAFEVKPVPAEHAAVAPEHAVAAPATPQRGPQPRPTPPVPPAPPVAPPAPAPGARASKWALGLSVMSLVTCCIPAWIIAFVLAIKGMRAAKSAGLPAPSGAVPALVVASLAAILSSSVWAVALLTKAPQTPTQVVQKRLEGKRDRTTLETDVACDLIHEQLLAGWYRGKTNVQNVACQGPFESAARRATLRGITVQFADGSATLTGCLGRASRWFAAALVDDEECPAGPWTSTASGSETARVEEEDSFRKAAAAAVDEGVIDRFMQQLTVARDALPQRHANRNCDGLDQSLSTSGAAAAVEAVDSALLGLPIGVGQGEGPSDWPFLTTSHVRVALRGDAGARNRAEAAREVQRRGPYLAVFSSVGRRWPRVMKAKEGTASDELGYAGGRFEGWMTIIDVRSGTAVCDGALSFRNSERVKFRSDSSNEESRLQAAVEADLESVFRSRAAGVIRTMSEGRLRLQ